MYLFFGLDVVNIAGVDGLISSSLLSFLSLFSPSAIFFLKSPPFFLLGLTTLILTAQMQVTSLQEEIASIRREAMHRDSDFSDRISVLENENSSLVGQLKGSQYGCCLVLKI